MKLSAGAFKQLRFTGALLLLAGLSIACWLSWNGFQERRQYLAGRDFRLLTVLASQTQAIIEGDAKVFQGVKTDSWEKWRANAQTTIPFLRDASFVDASTTDAVTTPHYAMEPDVARLRLDFFTNNQTRVMSVRLGVAAMLGPTFASKLTSGVFDTLVLATPSGRVVFAVGRRKQEVLLTPLDTLLAPTELTQGRTFAQYARTISVHNAVIAGVNYKLYIHPCCSVITNTSSTSSEEAPREGLIITGLVPADTVQSAALEISPSLVILGVILTLLALVTWPFLKLTFLGERQRVTLVDVIQLSVCSVAGLALGAILVVTADASERLQADVDMQLEGLAIGIRDHLAKEIDLAYDQLLNMVQLSGECRKGTFTHVIVGNEYRGCKPGEEPPQDDEQTAAASYPDYITFSLIGQNGMQQLKTTPAGWAPPLINVAARSYFSVVRDHHYWRDDRHCRRSKIPTLPASSALMGAIPGGCFVESLWSWTTGDPQAVVSMPTGDAELPVAALSVHMRSLFNPALPPGFEFAIVNEEGDVLFHSDAQRNTQENLFIETDNDRRLRALVSGHGSGAFSTMYWGRAYRAFVKPSGVPVWSIVTLSEDRSVQGLLVEWATVSLLLVGVYLAAWTLVILVALRMGSWWIWPDTRRRARYRLLATIYSTLLAVFGAVAFVGSSQLLLEVAVGVAATAWIAAICALWRRPRGDKADTQQPQRTMSDYTVAGTLFLMLSGIVPGVAFVVLSYDLHIESYVKHRQLGLARALATHPVGQEPGSSDELCGPRVQGVGTPDLAHLDRYCSFFYGTTVTSQLKDASKSSPDREAVEHHDLLLSLLEEYLPYYAESSVQMRELLHDAADDVTWTSQRTKAGQLELHVAQDDPTTELIVRSTLPAPMPFALKRSVVPAEDGHASLLLMPYVAPALLLGLGAVAYMIVRFFMRHVYLSNVFEPLWASGRLATAAGADLLVLCDDPSTQATEIRDASTLALGPIARSVNLRAAWTRARMRIRGGEPDRPVVITDMDADLDDVDVTHRKLELLEELINEPSRTVVVLSHNSTALLRGGIRAGRDQQDRELWTRLLNALVVVDWRDQPGHEDGSTSPTVMEWLRTLRRRWIPADQAKRRSETDGVLDKEGRNDRYVWRICEDIKKSCAFASGELTRDRLLDEIKERTASYYLRVWESCSDDEKVVLGHVAQHGLVNAASRHVVRRLLVRRLLIKDPDTRLMNSTFRSFVLARDRVRLVTLLEGSAEASAWDRLRLPFALGAVAAAAFLFATQRDMFNQTVAALAGVAAAVPTVARVASVVARRDAGQSAPKPDA